MLKRKAPKMPMVSMAPMTVEPWKTELLTLACIPHHGGLKLGACPQLADMPPKLHVERQYDSQLLLTSNQLAAVLGARAALEQPS